METEIFQFGGIASAVSEYPKRRSNPTKLEYLGFHLAELEPERLPSDIKLQMMGCQSPSI
jgi:hypothetical protein